MPSNHQATSAFPFEVRAATDAELGELYGVIEAGFGEEVSEAAIAAERTVLPTDRTIAVLERDRIVAGAGSYGFSMTVPGGGVVDAAGVTAVAVSATHRRRGLLTAMMRHQLADVASRGEPMAILNASEAPIYERFGYGLANVDQRLKIDPARVRFTRPLPERPPLRLVPRAHPDAPGLLAAAHDAMAASRPGMVRRSEAWWRIMLGDHEQWKGGGPHFLAVAEPFAGDPGGYAMYRMGDFGPDGGLRMTVREVVATTPDTEALLWHLLLTTDLVRGIEVQAVPVDVELRWWVDDPRAIRTTAVRDYLWVRLLDVPSSLEARAYGADGSLVLDVVDDFVDAGGRYRLEVDGEAVSCSRVDEGVPPQLRLDVAALGAAYLGGVGLDTLARAGRVEATSLDVLAQATAMFAWGRAPFCDTRF